MGRTLADEIADDVSDLLLDTDDFAELVIHHPLAGEAVSVPAIVQEFPPMNSEDTDKGVSQTFTAKILVSPSIGVITVGRGSEVSKFTVRDLAWRAVGKSAGHGSVIVQLERRSTAAVKKGFQQGTP